MIRDEVAVLRSLEGASYRARRDTLLTSSLADLESELASFVDSPLWTQAVIARIVLAKKTHGALHERVLTAIREADVERALKTAGGLNGLLNEFAQHARVDWGEGALPLAWETLLKEGDETPPQTLLFHLAILRGLPIERSVDVILAFMETRDDLGMIEASARTLAAFPTAMTDTKVATAYRRHDLVAGALQRLRVDIHYSAKEGR
ncbi:MAG: hypothetical protein IPK82_19510 [Polyangiaceae bacterium]|nr:hypothetical protein [Polyangiaceae bacterium]